MAPGLDKQACVLTVWILTWWNYVKVTIIVATFSYGECSGCCLPIFSVSNVYMASVESQDNVISLVNVAAIVGKVMRHFNCSNWFLHVVSFLVGPVTISWWGKIQPYAKIVLKKKNVFKSVNVEETKTKIDQTSKLFFFHDFGCLWCSIKIDNGCSSMYRPNLTITFEKLIYMILEYCVN